MGPNRAPADVARPAAGVLGIPGPSVLRHPGGIRPVSPSSDRGRSGDAGHRGRGSPLPGGRRSGPGGSPSPSGVHSQDCRDPPGVPVPLGHPGAPAFRPETRCAWMARSETSRGCSSRTSRLPPRGSGATALGPGT